MLKKEAIYMSARVSLFFKNLNTACSTCNYAFYKCNHKGAVFSSCVTSSFSTSTVKKKVYFPSFPRPMANFNNWAFGCLVRNYFEQEFELKEFLDTCPYVVANIIENLSSDDLDILKDAVEPECLENMINKWKKLSHSKKNYFTRLDAKDITCIHPTVYITIPEGIRSAAATSENLLAYLHFHVKVVFMANSKLIELTDNVRILKIFKDADEITFPVFHFFNFEREITKGVDGSWKLINCGEFPLLKLM